MDFLLLSQAIEYARAQVVATCKIQWISTKQDVHEPADVLYNVSNSCTRPVTDKNWVYCFIATADFPLVERCATDPLEVRVLGFPHGERLETSQDKGTCVL